MLGMAQRLFIGKYGKNPWQGNRNPHPTWPLLEKLSSCRFLNYVDIALAQKILLETGQEEACAAFICHLSQAARQGHLCVTISQNALRPAPEEQWILPDEAEPAITRSDIEEFQRQIRLGAEMLPPSLVCDAGKDPPLLKPFYKKQQRYYLHRYWQLESAVVEAFRSLLSQRAPRLPLDMGKIRASVGKLAEEKKLLPEQAQAVLCGCAASLTIITGGPGTGKTYTAGILLRELWEGMPPDVRPSCRIELAAPTGKAAANLESSIREAVKGCRDFPLVTAKTLHNLLGMRKEGPLFPRMLQADLLLIDESSMIDAALMERLLSSLKPGIRLIFLGDPHQLPPVESGSFFADLASHLKSKQDPALIELKTCLRTELQGILSLAEKVKLGDAAGALASFQKSAGIRLIPFEEGLNGKEQQRKFLKHALPLFPSGDTLPSDPRQLLKEFSRFRILAPLRQGPLGIEALNEAIFQECCKRHQHSFAVPIMIVQNDRHLKFVNGETGLLITHPKREKQRDYALFAGREENEVRKIPAFSLPPFEYAYCLSIHKSQGSEFEHVALLLPKGAELFGREALYTGITRSRRFFELWGDEEVLRRMIVNGLERNSGLKERLL